MILPALLTAAVVTIPPPAEAPETRLRLAAVAGVGSPDWVHAGVLGRLGDAGASLTLGTIGLGHSVSASGRYWLPEPVRGGYVEAGVSVVRVAALSPFSPGDLFPLGFASFGWQVAFGRWLLDAAVGPPPAALGGQNLMPLVAVNAMALPRFRLGVGHAF